MRRYTILHPFWLSFYSGDLYDDVAQNWTNITFVYLLLLLSIAWIPVMPRINDTIQTWTDVSVSKIVDQVPDITIENGKVSVSAMGPVLIQDPDTDQTILIIDVSGQYTSLDDTDASMLVMETKIIIRQSPSEVKTYPVPYGEEGERIVINRDVLYQWMDMFKSILSIILYPILVIASFVYRVIQIIIYGAIGLLFVQHLKATLEYSVLTRLAVIAITPAVILDTFHMMMDVSFPFWWLICFVLSMSYLYFGIKVNIFGVKES